MTPKRRARRFRGLFAHAADPQLPAGHAHLLQLLEYLLRHALRQVHVAVVFANVHAPDVHTLDVRFVGDGADDVSGLDTMYRPDFDAKSFHLCRTRSAGTLLCRGPLAWRTARFFTA